MNKYKNCEPVAEWFDSSEANNILSTNLRYDRTENDMQENGFFSASNSLPPKETYNPFVGTSTLQKSLTAPKVEPSPLMQQNNYSKQTEVTSVKISSVLPKEYHIFL